MPENPGIPPLFRDIFKNAYLPYRDPATLKMFLKVIDEFNYDHSEHLGDAFEYLLSVLGSQGDAGQFRTPRHIIDFMVEIIDPKKTETVLDPACGTAGFLISSYKHILKANSSPSPLAGEGRGEGATQRTGDLLTPDDKGRLAQNFKGYDISPDMVRLSLVNLYLHGFADPHIYEYDTLASQDRWNDYADVILANPPFMSPKGGIMPHKRFSVQSKRSEVLFVDYMAEHLTPQGRAGIIVPEGIIFQSGSAYVQLREMLIRESLIGIISLPSGVFQPYTGVKTSILVLDKQFAKKTKHIMFSNVQAIGISLGIKRTPTERNDLPHILRDYAAFYAGRELSIHSWLAERDAELVNGCNLTGERYRPACLRGATRSAKLGAVCAITKGTSSSTKTEPGPYPLIVTAEKWLTSSDYQFETDAVCVPLISSTGHGRASIKRIHYATGKFAVANLLAAVQPLEETELDTRFLYLMLDAEKDNIALLMNGAANVSMKVEDLAEFEIPLPPIELQKEIVTEIEDYQKVINGARAICDNYRPHIPIHPNWPMVEFGRVIDILTDFTANGSFASLKGNVDYHRSPDFALLVRLTDLRMALKNKDQVFVSEKAYTFLKKSSLHGGEFLLANVGANIGDAYLMPSIDQPATLGPNMFLLKFTADVLPAYVFYLNKSGFLKDRIVALSQSAAQPKINKSELRSILIPLPSIATQQAIVAEIDAEQALVAANHELITRFEKKIQTTLARVWGEGKDEG